MSSLDDAILKAIEPVDATLFELVATGPNVPAESDVAAYESSLGFALPVDFRALVLSALGGLYVRARPEAWPLHEEYDIAPAWTFLRGVALFGMATDIPEERLDLRFQLSEAQERGRTGFAPALKIDGDIGMWGFDPSGAILREDEAGHVEADPEQDFGALYAREIAGLIERQARVAGDGAG